MRLAMEKSLMEGCGLSWVRRKDGCTAVRLDLLKQFECRSSRDQYEKNKTAIDVLTADNRSIEKIFWGFRGRRMETKKSLCCEKNLQGARKFDVG